MQTLQHELQLLHEQVEILGIRAMELQGQLHESEDLREQDLLQHQNELAHQRMLIDNFRSEYEANHIIELLAEKEACLKAVRETHEEREKREEAERALKEQQNSVEKLRKRVEELEAQLQQQAKESQCAEEEHFGRLRQEELRGRAESARSKAMEEELTKQVNDLRCQQKQLAKKLQVMSSLVECRPALFSPVSVACRVLAHRERLLVLKDVLSARSLYISCNTQPLHTTSLQS